MRKQKRSRTGAYAPPHLYAVNHRQMILVRGCYNTILMCRQGTAAICRKFCLWQNKIVFQRSRTGAYAPPHFYAVNHRQMILIRGCYCASKNVLSHCVASRILCGKIIF